MQKDPQRNLVGNNLYFYEHVTANDIERKTFMLDRIIMCNVIKGNARFELNGRLYEINSKNILLLPPHSNIHLISASPDLEVLVVGFIMALQETIIQKLGSSFFTYIFKKVVWELTPEGKRIINSYCDIYNYHCSMPADTYSADIASSLFNIFLLSFYQNIKERFEEDRKTSVNSRSLTTRFVFLMNENYKEHHNVGYYADKLCVSSKYLTQIIKTNTGFTPKVAIDRQLGVEALFMLGNTAYNIQEISNQLGFPDQSYFGRFFKRLFGISPLAYRQNPDMKLMERLRKENDAMDKTEEDD